jgi:hypothetical protein
VGVFIAVLGLLGVLVPLLRDLNQIGRREKALWTFVMFFLVWLEIRSIYLDRDTHDKEQAAARQEQLEQFGKIAQGINTTSTSNQQHFDATMGTMNSLLQTTQATKLNTEPEAYLTMNNFGVYRNSLPMGPNRQLEFNVFYQNKGNEAAKDVVADGKIYLGKTDDPKREAERLSREFEKWWQNPPERPAGHWRVPIYAAGDQEGFFSIDAPRLTAEEFSQLQNNTLTFYTFVRFLYSDHSGRWAHERCEWMQNASQDFNVVRSCFVNNNPRFKVRH